jgi:hypothetical protein
MRGAQRSRRHSAKVRCVPAGAGSGVIDSDVMVTSSVGAGVWLTVADAVALVQLRQRDGEFIGQVVDYSEESLTTVPIVSGGRYQRPIR